MWHELKENIRRVKPRSKEELVGAIKTFWRSVDVAKCKRYIKHLEKVLPRMVELNGAATGYWLNYINFCLVHVFEYCSGTCFFFLGKWWILWLKLLVSDDIKTYDSSVFYSLKIHRSMFTKECFIQKCKWCMLHYYDLCMSTCTSTELPQSTSICLIT